MENISVIHTVQGIGERLGGPSRTVTKLCSGIVGSCTSVDLVAGFDPDQDPPLVRPSADVGLHLCNTFGLGPFRFFKGFGSVIGNLAESRRGKVIVHDHGIWAQSNFISFNVARRFKVPYVLSPRGMLEPWALNYKAGKKKVAWAAYQHNIVKNASLIVATSEQERESVKRILPKALVAVIPNGVDLPDQLVTYESRFGVGGAGKPRNFIFLSRIHPKKNLMALLDAWSELHLPPGANLIVAGPDELNHTVELKRRVKELGIGNSVQIRGAVSENEKLEFYSSGHVFVLPSFSENFGVVVAEALSFGLPVIATTGTPWSGLTTKGCGWWVSPDKEGIKSALASALELSSEQLYEMGLRGRAYAKEEFSWAGVSQSMIDIYAWVSDGTKAMPFCVS